jgi:alanine dehydrogenase
VAEQAFLWITEADVVSLMDMGEAIEALTDGLRLEGQSQAQNLAKTHTAWDQGSTLHALGAVFPEAGFAGTKTWCHTKGGATPLLMLFDSRTGALKAIIEAFALGQLRTGAASGVATRWLASPDVNEFAIIGTGKQALAQVAAMLAVRPIRHVRVFGRDEGRRAECAERIAVDYGVRASAYSTVREAIEQAAIITVVTRAQVPIVSGDMVARGTHINAIGAIAPDRVELSQDVLARASRIVVDSVAQARRLSRELIELLGDDSDQWARVEPLAQIVARQAGRASSDDLTVFKAMGMGISDLSLGIRLYALARERHLGCVYPHPERVPPRFGFPAAGRGVER